MLLQRPWYRRPDYFLLGWRDPSVWRAAVVEGAATALLVFVTVEFGVTIGGYGTAQVGGYVGIFNAVALAVFIYAAGPASGGHLNPLITFAAFLCGLCPAPRTALYLAFQTLGGSLGGALVRGALGTVRAEA